MRLTTSAVASALLLLLLGSTTAAQLTPDQQNALDRRVQQFLDARRYTWHDLNVTEADGRALHDIIVKHGYTRALEIGTSTGHSGTWIAWALAKTGGKLVTIEIDDGRHQQAQQNFEQAGLAVFVDARLGDAHALVPRLDGPFDFVFIDADKDWYTSYAKAVIPKLVAGGCLTAHNVSPRGGWRSQTADFYPYLTSLSFMDTTIINGGLAVSYKH